MAKRHWTQEEIEKLVQPKPTHWRWRDIEGRRFGTITVGRYCGTHKQQSLWECICDCGRRYVSVARTLTRPWTKSCGCLKTRNLGKGRFLHGMKHSTEYEIWCGIKKRCFNPKCDSYPHYGGRGISMHPEWVESFLDFYLYVGDRPSKNHSLDRIDNNGHYEPGNVRWATRIEQANNSRKCRMITAYGITRSASQWSRETGVNVQTIVNRLNHGWTEDRAVSVPSIQNKECRNANKSTSQSQSSQAT